MFVQIIGIILLTFAAVCAFMWGIIGMLIALAEKIWVTVTEWFKSGCHLSKKESK